MGYSPVFSQGFIYSSSSAPNNSFEVPTGFTAVIRDFSIWTAAAATYVQLQVQLSTEAPVLNVAQLSTGGLYEYAQWQGRVVVPGGGFMEVNIDTIGSEADIYVGGYLLRNTVS